jgi:hypothetical protein
VTAPPLPNEVSRAFDAFPAAISKSTVKNPEAIERQ